MIVVLNGQPTIQVIVFLQWFFWNRKNNYRPQEALLEGERLDMDEQKDSNSQPLLIIQYQPAVILYSLVRYSGLEAVYF